jgi:predicted permease
MTFDGFKALVRSLQTRKRLDEDMDDEMRFHIQEYERDLVRRGLPAPEAAWRARNEFGNISRAKEECREVKGVPMLDEVVRNIRYAFRQLRRSPGFAITVTLTLGLCIGVNTAAFSLTDAVLVRPLPYPEPDRLFEAVREMRRGSEFQLSTGQDGYAWEALKNSRSIQVAAVGSTGGVNLGSGDRAVYVQQQRVSMGYFRVLGIPLAHGREFDDAEDRSGGPPAVVLSNGIWRRIFHGDESVVGRPILLRGEPHVVVGIAAEVFRPTGLVDLWTPLKPSTRGEGAGINYRLIARLNSSATLAQAQAEVQARGTTAFENRRIPPSITARMSLAPFERLSQAALRERLLVISSAAALILLIGCVNIASLMLARGSARGREIGTRIALGGGTASLARQLATESLVLGAAGGAAGLALGYVATRALQAAVARYGIWQELRMDRPVLLATALVSLLVSLLFGLAPIVRAVRVNVREALFEGGSRSVVGGRSDWLRRTLVLAEVAMSLMLLVGAGLLIRTLLNLQHLDPGFDGTNVLTATASLQDARYRENENINRLFSDSLEAIRKEPGVESAAVGLHVPYQRWLNSGAKIRGRFATVENEIGASMNYVTPGYFEVLRIPVRAGRVIDERDRQNSMPVALVNESLAHKFLKGQDPLTGFIIDGKTIRQIVGVVGDLQQQPGLSRSGPIVTEPAIYIPAAQFSSGAFQLAHTWYSPNWVVRATGRREVIARAIERAISGVDPLLPVAQFRSMIDERESALGSQRLNAWLFGGLAALALSLALVGVYGVVANSVVERMREFGIRIALGGSLRRVIWEPVAPVVLLSIGGVAIGGLLAVVSVRVLKGMLYGVQPADAPTFVIMGSALIAISAVASLIPALSLARLAPADVLRQD